MSALPVRLFLYVVLPGVLGGALAWGMRPVSSATTAVTAPPAGPSAPRSAAADAARERRAAELRLDSPLSDQRRFCDRLRGANFEQMQDLLNEAQTFADAFRRRSARELVLEEICRTDPTRGWAFVSTWERGTYRRSFLHAWGRVDAEGAVTWAEGQGDAGAAHVRDIITGLLPDDLATFAKILPRLKPEHVSEAQLGTAFRQLAAEDSAQALTFFKSMPDGTRRNSAASSLAEGWARRDSAGAYAWAKDLADPAQRESALRGVFRAWAETDPQGVAAKLGELAKDTAVTKDARGESPARAIVRAWAAQDPKAAAAWLRDRAAEDSSSTFRQLFGLEILPTRDEWAATDLADMLRRPGEKLVTEEKAAMPYNHSMSWGDEDGEMVRVLGQFGGYNSPLRGDGYPGDTNQTLRLSDPAKAFDELAKQPGDASRQHVLHEVAAQFVEKDPQAAMAKLQETTDEWLKLGLVNALSARARQTSDPALAAEIAKAFPKGSWQGQSMVSEVYGDIASRDPERARTLLAGDLDPSSKMTIASALATQQATYDPVGAVAWAAQQADENLQRSTTQSAVSGWARADAYAASEWLAAQPAGPLREAGVQGLISALSENAPDDALQWAATLTDPQQRESQQMNIVQNLLYRDFQKAKELAAELPFSEQMRKNLDRMIESREKHAF